MFGLVQSLLSANTKHVPIKGCKKTLSDEFFLIRNYHFYDFLFITAVVITPAMCIVNCTETGLSEEDFPNALNYGQRIILAAFFCLISCGSIIGNVWTLFSLPKRIYKTYYKCCLASLSLSDLLLGVLVSLDNTVRLVSPDIGWHLSDGMCNAVPFLTTSCVLASSFTLTCVAADRFIGLAWLHVKFKPNLVVSVSFLVTLWIVSIGFSILMLFIYSPTEACLINFTTCECTQCSISLCLGNNSDYAAYFTFLYIAIFLPVLGVFMICNIMIAWRVWGARRPVGHNDHTPSTITSSTEVGVNTVTTSNPKPSVTVLKKKKMRTFYVVLIIIITFVICRLPQWTFTLVSLQTPVSGESGYLARYSLSNLNVFNTAINPLLYSFLDSMFDFRCTLFPCFKK